MKYIIDIPDDGQCQYRYNEDTKELKFPCPRFDPNSFMGLDIIISGATPYTEPDREAIENEVRVGDEIVSELTKTKGVVIAIDAWDAWHCVSEIKPIIDITADKHKYWKKTDRHFDEVEGLINKMRDVE